MNNQTKPTTTSPRSSGGNRFPLVVVVHLVTVFALLCGCLSPADFRQIQEQWQMVLAVSVGAAVLGAFVGVCVGLGAVRRMPAVLSGAAIGAVATLFALGLIASGNPLRMLIVGAAILLVPLAIRGGHA